jgi:hypothetical protein
MTSVNANVQGILADLAAKRNAGELDGYESQPTEQELTTCLLCRQRGEADGMAADPNRLPAFFSKGYIYLTAYQQGYIAGRYLRVSELRDRSDHA